MLIETVHYERAVVGRRNDKGDFARWVRHGGNQYGEKRLAIDGGAI